MQDANMFHISIRWFAAKIWEDVYAYRIYIYSVFDFLFAQKVLILIEWLGSHSGETLWLKDIQ